MPNQQPNKQTEKVLSSDLKGGKEYIFKSTAEKHFKSNIIGAAISIVIGTLMFGTTWYLNNEYTASNLSIDSEIKQQKNTLKKVENEIKLEGQKKANIITTLTKEVESIQENGYKWSRALSEIKRITGPHILISKISGHFDPKGEEGSNSMSISGETNSFSALASYIEEIES